MSAPRTGIVVLIAGEAPADEAKTAAISAQHVTERIMSGPFLT
jgi:hypothetical protein